MADDLITFVIDGGDARNGNVSATVFANKLMQFLSALYGLDRAFAGAGKRQIDLEVVGLQRNSPARVAMRARSKVPGYDPHASLRWCVDQLENIRNGGSVDRRVPESVLAAVINLADYKADKTAEIRMMQVELGATAVPLDRMLAGHAMVARAIVVEGKPMPWRAGVSYGSVFGELMGIMDIDGERKFYIRPPSGPSQVQCIFPETLRPQMVESLFKVVRASGYLHYDGQSAHPHLLEADAIEGRSPPSVHLLDLGGAFPGLVFEPFVGDLA